MKITEQQLTCLVLILKDSLNGMVTFSRQARSDLLNEIINQQDNKLILIGNELDND